LLKFTRRGAAIERAEPHRITFRERPSSTGDKRVLSGPRTGSIRTGSFAHASQTLWESRGYWHRRAASLHDELFRRNGFEPPSAPVLTVSLHLYMRLIETGRWLGLVPASVMPREIPREPFEDRGQQSGIHDDGRANPQVARGRLSYEIYLLKALPHFVKYRDSGFEQCAIVNTHARDVTGSQSKAGEKENDRTIASPPQRVAVTCSDEAINLTCSSVR
jgi:hypothetical protein